MAEIAIIDYGVGNLRSVERAFGATGNPAVITGDDSELRAAKGLVLPGVGAFAACMNALKERGFDDVVREHVSRGKPLLGICVGMQMLFEESDEFGATPGLALIKGKVRRFSSDQVVPHVGWNQVEKRSAHPILSCVKDETFFYFVHSYYCDAQDKSVVAGETNYGVTYASVIGRDELCGVQFHPEKSQSAGLRLLKNFAFRVRFDAWE